MQSVVIHCFIHVWTCTSASIHRRVLQHPPHPCFPPPCADDSSQWLRTQRLSGFYCHELLSPLIMFIPSVWGFKKIRFWNAENQHNFYHLAPKTQQNHFQEVNKYWRGYMESWNLQRQNRHLDQNSSEPRGMWSKFQKILPGLVWTELGSGSDLRSSESETRKSNKI